MRISHGSQHLLPVSSPCHQHCQVPLPGPVNRQCKPAQKSCACCHQLLLGSGRAVLIRASEEWKEDTELRFHRVGAAGYLVQILCLPVPCGKGGPTPLPCFLSRGIVKEGTKPAVLPLSGASGPGLCTWSTTIAWGMWGKGCQTLFPKSSTERSAFCTHQTPERCAQKCLLELLYQCLTVPQDSYRNYNADKMAHRSVLWIPRKCGDIQEELS